MITKNKLSAAYPYKVEQEENQDGSGAARGTGWANESRGGE